MARDRPPLAAMAACGSRDATRARIGPAAAAGPTIIRDFRLGEAKKKQATADAVAMSSTISRIGPA